MLLVGFLRYCLGSVKFSVQGGMPERFLNYASRDGINIWSIRRKDGAVQACVRARSFKKLRGPVRKSHVRLRIIKKRGLPFIIHRYRKRSGILTGIIAFLLVIWFLSGFIWSVNITGNSTVSSGDISETLADLGVKPGSYSSFLNIKEIEQKVLVKIPELSWITINIKGSTANVKVRERTYPAQIVDADIPCNVKALYSGQIITLEAYGGKALLNEGDAVQKGEIIVSGTVELKDGETQLVHASAKVIARTKRSLSETVAFTQDVQAGTGKVIEKKELVLASLNIPLYFGSLPEGSYIKTYTVSYAYILGVKLPLGIKNRVFTEYKTEKVTLSQKEAQKKAEQLLAADEKKEFSGATVLKKDYAVTNDNSGVTVTGAYTCEENIAYQEEIKIN